MKCLIRTVVLVIISIILFIFSTFITLWNSFSHIKEGKTGGSLLDVEFRCSVLDPPFINAGSLLRNDYYVFATNDDRIINFPYIRTFYWRTKNGMNCLEVIQPEVDIEDNKTTKKEIQEKQMKDKKWAIPIILDIIKYHDRDIRNLDFDKRLKILEDFCSEVKLEVPKYTLFNHTKNFGEQFSKILMGGSEKQKIKIIIFKDPNKKYFYSKSSYKWINRNLLEMIGMIRGENVEFLRFKGKEEQSAPLINDEFPLRDLIKSYKGEKEDVIIYIENDILKIKSAIKGEIDKITLLNDAKNIWIQMNKGLTIDGFLGNTLDVMKKLQRVSIDSKLFSHIDEHSSILDIGAGRGANIFMWKRKKLDVYAVEPDSVNYDKLVDKKNIYSIHTLKAGGEDSSKIMNFIPDEGVDYVAMIYSLTFFFKTEKILNNLVNLIDKALKPRGYYIGAVMDGNKLLKWAKEKDKKEKKINCPPFYIKIKDDHDVLINIDDPVSLVKNQKEYIVDFELLKKKLNNIGIILDNTGFLEKEANLLNKCPKKFTELSRWFIFRKK